MVRLKPDHETAEDSKPHESDSHSSRVCASRLTARTSRDLPATAVATPTIDQLISLKRAGSPAISPDGQWVAYTVRETNWDDNNYHTEIWLADAKTGGRGS